MLDRIKGGMMTPQVDGTTPAIHRKQYISVTGVQKLMMVISERFSKGLVI